MQTTPRQDSEILQFHPLTAEEYPNFAAALAPLFSDCMSCESSAVNLVMWQDFYGYRVAYDENAVFISLKQGQNELFLVPFAKDLKKACLCLENYAVKKNIPLNLFGSQSARLNRFLNLYPEYEAVPSRNDFEYIYATEKLATLSGKAYHAKRNHIAAFSRQYDWHYCPLTDQNAADALAVARVWAEDACQKSDDIQSVRAEEKGLQKLLKNRQTFGVEGGLIYIENRAVAFCLGSPLGTRVFDVNVEKALPQYREAFTVINREFAKQLLGRFEYINREDDMGLEGLRRAKLSYKPEILLEKYELRKK